MVATHLSRTASGGVSTCRVGRACCGDLSAVSNSCGAAHEMDWIVRGAPAMMPFESLRVRVTLRGHQALAVHRVNSPSNRTARGHRPIIGRISALALTAVS